MEKYRKSIKRNRKKPIRKFKCILCEKIVMNSKQIKKRKNYSHGKHSKKDITYIHRKDEGILVELKRKKKNGI